MTKSEPVRARKRSTDAEEEGAFGGSAGIGDGSSAASTAPQAANRKHKLSDVSFADVKQDIVAPGGLGNSDRSQHEHVPSTMGTGAARWVWGDSLTQRQRAMYTCFMAVFFLAIGGYWLIRPMKMGVFIALVGLVHEPEAKLGTVFILVPLLMGYSKLVNVLNNPKRLATIVLTTYASVFVVIGCCLALPTIGMANTEASPSRLLGWITYWAIESYGSVVVAMLWSVMASVSNAEAATSAYPIIVIASQLGAISGATLATHTAYFGFPALFMFVGVLAVVAIVLTHLAFRFAEHGGDSVPSSSSSSSSSKGQTGLLEGLRLIAAKRYVTAIFVISTFSEIVGTIMDFQMKVKAKEVYTTPSDFSAFMGRFGQFVNGVSLVFALTGTKWFIRTFGLRFCLLAFPTVALGVIGVVFFFSDLWVLFFGMISLKALGYSLNNPSKEMCYLQTSKDVKFKAKSWIDMFGTRFAKAAGSLVNTAFRKSASDLLFYGSGVSSGFTLIWVFAARYLGMRHQQLVANDEIVG